MASNRKNSGSTGISRRKFIAAATAAAATPLLPKVAFSSATSSVTAGASLSTLGTWGKLLEGDSQGQPQPVPPDWPYLQAVHAAHLPSGKIILWGGLESWQGPTSPGFVHLYIYDAHNKTFAYPQDIGWIVPKDVFCGGHCVTKDGHLFICGGTKAGTMAEGHEHAFLFHKDTLQLSQLADMNSPRWYPTVTRLSDGQVMSYSGWMNPAGPENHDPDHGDYDDRPELYEGGAGWDAIEPDPLINPQFYPFMFTIHDPSSPGSRAVLYCGKRLRDNTLAAERSTWILRPDTEVWQRVCLNSTPNTYPNKGSTAILWIDGTDPIKSGRVYKFGGEMNGGHDAVDVIMGMDMDASSDPQDWQWAALSETLTDERQECDAVILPNGLVLIVGGGFHRTSGPVMNCEIFSPYSETILGVTPDMDEDRMYHSIAVHLPDGSVLVAGGEKTGFVRNKNGQRYFPPYYFLPRPEITSSPTVINYNDQVRLNYLLPGDPSLESLQVTMLGLSAVTHSFDMEQRFINLTLVEQAGSDEAMFYTPKNGGVAPPGYYMLFVVLDGVPSYGKYVMIE